MLLKKFSFFHFIVLYLSCAVNAEETTKVCQDGYFGEKCSYERHCHGGNNTENSSRCKYGCQTGWMGDLCNTRKLKAKALYYCFNSKHGGKVMVFRADQMGINYMRVRAVDDDNVPVAACSKRYFKRSGDRLTIKIVEIKTGFLPRCSEKRISENTYRWKFEFREFPKSISAYDVTFVTTCNFASSGSFHRSTTTENKIKGSHMNPIIRSNLTVELRVVDPHTGQTIRSASLGTHARLVLYLFKTADIGVQAITPHTCVAATEDGQVTMMLLDENGCQNNESHLIFGGGNGTTWWSKPFEVFTFPGYDHVTFTCQFRVCFKENIDKCSVYSMCRSGDKADIYIDSNNRQTTAGTKLSIG